MTISRGQMNRQLYMGGGIMNIVPREQALLGGVKKAFKKATKVVKDVASSDVGKAALLYGATAGLGSIGSGQTGLARFAPSNFMGNLGRIGSFITGGTIGTNPVDEVALTGKQNIFQKALSAVGIGGDGKGMGNLGKLATLGAVSTFLTQSLGMTEEQAEEELARDPSGYLEQYYRNLNPPTADTNSEEYEAQVRDFVVRNTSEYAVGGRVGLAMGSPRGGMDPLDKEVFALEGLEEQGILSEKINRKRPTFEYFKDIMSEPNFEMPAGSDERDDLREIMLFGDNDMAKAKQIIDEQGLNELYETAVEIVGNNDEANEYFLDLVNSNEFKKGNFSAADAYYSVIKNFGDRDLLYPTLPTDKAEGGRIGFSDGTYNDFKEFMEKRGKAMRDFDRNKLLEEFEQYMKSQDPTVEAAEGGRIGFANGPVLPPDPTQPVNPFGPKPGDFGIEEDIPIKTASYGFDEAMSDTYDSYLEMKRKGLIPPTMDFDEFLQEVVPNMSNKRIKETRSLAAIGGKMDTASDNAMQAAGIEGLPIRRNPKGVKELDLRETGGFIQPVGIKEKEDDIPAMLSNNEFVMTADAVRGMGGGDVNLGAQRMYDQMKMLEAGGKV